MNAMIRIRTHFGLTIGVVGTIVFDGLTIIADANDWSRQAHAAIALFTMAIMIGLWRLLTDVEHRRRMRAAPGWAARWIWRRLTRRRAAAR
jgi:hypothetical protein